MKELNEKQLKSVVGGISIWTVLASIAAAVFGIGVLDGYTRPLKCH